MTKGMTYDSRGNRTIEEWVIAEERLMTKESTLWQKAWSYGKRGDLMTEKAIPMFFLRHRQDNKTATNIT